MIVRIRRARALVIALGLVFAVTGARSIAQSASARQHEAAREAWQKVSEILTAMGIAPGAVVADVGAGDGFLTVRLARAVGPAGHVVAVDITDGAIERLRARVQQDGLTNVTVTKGEADDPRLNPASLDAAVIINSYHEMADHRAMLRQLRMALKPGGRLVIIEPISEKRLTAAREQQIKEHEIAARYVEQEARDAGFRVQQLLDPFTTRGNLIEWLIVAVPQGSIASETTPDPSPSEEAALASPDLRIAFDTFKRRRAEGSIVVVDVRSEEEHLAGHIPGATWIELSDLNSHIDELRALQKPIVTYCS
jgi:ubiquinone/menaquinone biosynthesis C-methylase UbiE